MEKTNIVLIGFMCSGKTSVARILANMLNFDFIDTDILIEERFNMSIDQIFNRYGEAFFRNQELQIAEKLRNDKFKVISTGGGMVLNPDIMNKLKVNGTIFWLKAPVKELLKRIDQNNNNRPLLTKANSYEIHMLYKKRRILYERYCDYSIYTGQKTPKQIAQYIINIYKKEVYPIQKK
jgi:shikimate kinase